MPVGGGGKPAGGYRAGKKGSYGCKGYPTVSADGTVHGCHPTKAAAAAQARAIWASVNSQKADSLPLSDFIEKSWSVAENHPGCTEGFAVVGDEGNIHGCFKTRAEAEAAAAAHNMDDEENMDDNSDDMHMSMDEEERYGRRHNEMHKADSYTPTSGMKAAARRALKWKEDGKATGAGTPVGWGRASDIVAGRSMSLSVVRRMYSFFSRHEVDKKGKDFYNTSNPSNGRIMWDAWGGDAGFSWSRGIVERMKDKSLFADFGKDYTKSEQLVVKAIGVGSMVSWNSSGGMATGKITRIIRNGSYNVPGTDVTVNGTQDDPAAVIRIYQDGKPTDTVVAHRMSTLRAS